MTATTQRHPLDRLHDAPTFDRALAVYRDACAFEADLFGDPSGVWSKRVGLALIADDIARNHGRDTAADLMRLVGLEDFAAALETGDWSPLEF